MNIKQKIVGGLATAALLGSTLVPMASATGSSSVTISGNGAGSHNKVFSFSLNKTKVKQSSKTIANTFVVSAANSGGNKANGNTGGSVSNTSGNASSTVNVTVSGGDNTATVPSCGCPSSDGSVEISGNGALSKNTVVEADVNVTTVKQSNTTVANTAVVSAANTGGNTASWNTGGDVTQTSGDASSNVTVSVSGGDNTLNP